jgi:hypothetical protein
LSVERPMPVSDAALLEVRTPPVVAVLRMRLAELRPTTVGSKLRV